MRESLEEQPPDPVSDHIRRIRAEYRLDEGDAAFVPSLWPEPLDLESLAEREPETPDFIIDDWLPCGYATLLSGHGGVGKSLIALYLAVCVAAGVPFFGLEVRRKRVLYLSCEDRAAVLHWRLARSCAHLGVNLASLRGWLNVLDLVGHRSVLWEKDPRTGSALTAVYGNLCERITKQQSQVLIGDGVSDLFGGNENSRAEVKQFINSLLTQIPLDGATLLLGHVPKPTASGAGGEGYSGSTGWHNSVRSRWYLYRETTQGEEGDRQRTGKLILELQKSNLGRDSQSMRFTWDEETRLFIGEVIGATAFDRQHRDRTERTAILRTIKSCAEQKPPVIVPAAMQGPRTAVNTLRIRQEWPASLGDNRGSRVRFERLIEALRQDGLVEEQEYKRGDRHTARRLALTDKGLRECGQY